MPVFGHRTHARAAVTARRRHARPDGIILHSPPHRVIGVPDLPFVTREIPRPNGANAPERRIEFASSLPSERYLILSTRRVSSSR